jgi:alpha-D-ribose 1-methylphosphonate 5-triphosphate synthase subunit PhnL
LTAADARLVREVRRETLGHVSQFLRVIPRVPALDIVAEPLVARGMALDAARAKAKGAALAAEHAPCPARAAPRDLLRRRAAAGEPGAGLRAGLPRAAARRADREPGRRRTATWPVALIREAKAAGAAVVGIFHDTDVRDRVATACSPSSPDRRRAGAPHDHR